MLKKTMIATVTIGATLFAVAAVLPEITQSRGGATSSATTPTTQALARAPAQDQRATEASSRDGSTGSATAGAGREGSGRAIDNGARGHTRGSDHDGPEGKRDHDESDD